MVLLGLAVPGKVAGAGAQAQENVPFRVLLQGTFEVCVNPCYEVISDAGQWDAFWQQARTYVYMSTSPPSVDFTREAALVVGLGRVPSSGYSIEVERITRTRGSLEASVRQVEVHGFAMFHGESPFEILAVPHPVMRVQFVVEAEDYHCPPELVTLCQPQGTPLALGGRCAPPGLYDPYTTVCFRPSQVTQAERSLQTHPIDPSASVLRLTHLTLRQAITFGWHLRPDNPHRMHAIHYLYGAVPPPIEQLQPPGTHPTFVDVVEYDGLEAAPLSAPSSERLLQRVVSHVGATLSSPGVIYTGPWEFRARIPHHHLWLMVIADAQRPVVQRLGLSVLQALVQAQA